MSKCLALILDTFLSLSIVWNTRLTGTRMARDLVEHLTHNMEVDSNCLISLIHVNAIQ
jgi:hypothetical protein